MRQKQGEPEKNPWFLSERSSSIRTTSVHAWSLLAWSLLEHSDNLAPRLIGANARFGLPLVRIWEDPRGLGGDRDPFSLTVFQPFSSTDRSIVRKAVWRRSLDLRRLLDPVEEQDMPVSFDPTITVTDVPVPGNEWEAILHTGLNIRLPLVTLRDSESVSSDVGSVGFEFLTQDEPQTKVSLEWPWDTHSEWQPAIEFVTRVRVFLESCLDWHDLLRGWAVETTLADRTFQDVCKRYGEPGRFYHTLDHIHSVLRTVESLGANARHLNAVKLAAWLHDVVYDSRASDNEERSAEYAERLCEELSIPEGSLVTSLIRKTKAHIMGDDPDAQVLIDADLAVLGESEPGYRDYAERIRQEYAWVPEAEFRKRRRQVLRNFLNRPTIYHFLTYLEEFARRNLAAEIAQLAS